MSDEGQEETGEREIEWQYSIYKEQTEKDLLFRTGVAQPRGEAARG